jgi:uncharacterized protein with PQ loop repeat
MNSTSKIFLVVLLLLCLAPMPYVFYTIARVVFMIGFAIIGANYWQQKKVELGILFMGLALIFQPVFKIYLGRTLWNILDVIVAGIIIYTIITDSKKINN